MLFVFSNLSEYSLKIYHRKVQTRLVVNVSRMAVGTKYKVPMLEPEEWVGAQYLGWEKNVSRDMSVYIRPMEHTIISGKADNHHLS